MITPQLIQRMSAAPIEPCKTPAADHKSTLTRRRVKQNTAGFSSSLPAVRAGGRPNVQHSLNSLKPTPAPKVHEIAEWVECKALPAVVIVILFLIALNAPSWAAKAAANVTF